MSQPKPRMISAWTRCQGSASVLLCCTPLVFAPLSVQAEQAESETEAESFRLAPIIVNARQSRHQYSRYPGFSIGDYPKRN